MDIYSLGIVLIELFASFNTGMERAVVLSKIREGVFPTDWATDTHQTELAQSMVHRDPTQRPSARQILEFLVEKNLLVEPDSSILLNIIAQLRERVCKLEKLLEVNNIEIP